MLKPQNAKLSFYAKDKTLKAFLEKMGSISKLRVKGSNSTPPHDLSISFDILHK